MDARQEVEALLKRYKAVLIRNKKHRIWKLPDGRKWTTPSTVSDRHSWQNNLGSLRLALGLKAPDKKQEEFNHQKKEVYKKMEQAKAEFLGDLPEREERPETPVSVSPLEQGLEPQPREIVTLYGKAPLVGSRHGLRKGSGTKTGQGFSYSSEVLARASFLRETQGEDAVNKFLETVKEGREMNHGFDASGRVETNGGTNEKRIANGSIEEALRAEREKIKHYAMVAQNARMEVARSTEVVKALETALRLATASRTEIQGVLTGTAELGEKTRMDWKPLLTEVIGTTPVSLTRRTLISEVRKLKPLTSKGAVYQAMLTGLRKGWLVEENGLLRVRQEAS